MSRIRPREGVLADHDPRLAYGQLGDDGPPLVLLHGLGARWQAFTPLMIRLHEDFRLVAPDLRGHGESGRAGGQYRLEDFSADVARVIEATTTPPVTVYGHSLGGWIALALCVDRPDLVRSVIVADTAIYPVNLDPGLVVSYLSNVPITLRSMAKSLDQLDPEVLSVFRSGGMLRSYQPDRVIARVTCPVLLLQGDPRCEGLMTDADVARTREILPDATVVRFDGVGHGLHLEDGEGVANAVRMFAEAHSASIRTGDPEP